MRHTLTVPVRFVITGAPRTKKNHGRRVYAFAKKRVVNIPSAAYEAWEFGARAQILPMRIELPDAPYNVAAIFYRDAERGDAVGYYQGLADLLEKAGVVSNDKWIVSWDGSRLAVDRARPRVDITITAATWAAMPTPAA